MTQSDDDEFGRLLSALDGRGRIILSALLVAQRDSLHGQPSVAAAAEFDELLDGVDAVRLQSWLIRFGYLTATCEATFRTVLGFPSLWY